VAGDPGTTTARRIAVVGCGGAGQMHVDALARAGVSPTALIDPDPSRRALLAERWPGIVTALSPDLVADAFDVAIVAVPDQLHAPVTIGLLQAGKDVLVEKPLAGTRAEADAMVGAASSTGRLLAVAQVRRHLAVKGWAHDLLRSGALGAVTHVDASQGGRDDWIATGPAYVGQAAGGMIASSGVYSLDLLTWWFGPLELVSCRDDSRGWQEADATVELLAGDIPIHLEMTRIRSGRNTVRVHTERGLLEVALDHYQERQLFAVPEGLEIVPFVEVDEDLEIQFDRQLRAFLDALDGRWPSTLATGADGSMVAGVIEDCYAQRTSDEPWWLPSATRRTDDVDAPRAWEPERPVGVLGATGAVGGRFVEIVSGEGRAPLRVLLHRWWHTARLVRSRVELCSPSVEGSTADAFASSLDGCAVAASFIDGADVDPSLAEALIDGCVRSAVDRVVHLGCLTSYGAVTTGRLSDEEAPPPPPRPLDARRWAFEQALLDAGERAGIDVVVLAAPLIYGPFAEAGTHRLRDDVARGRVAVARDSGPCHVIFVDDVVDAMWAAMTVDGAVHGRFFVSGPAPITWPVLFEAFEPFVGRPAVAVLPDEELRALAASVAADPEARDALRWPPLPGAGRRLVGAIERRTIRRGSRPPVRRRLVVPDPDELVARAIAVEVPLDRAAAVLGWAPQVDFTEGMRRTEAYLRWADPRT
jgi:predicted dehydrogenase/nucleoside-diphosphate-sugar epimerase